MRVKLPEHADTATTRAVLYAAVSTEDRNGSIPEQLDDCRQMAKDNGWTIVGECVDENFTAYTGNRGPRLAAAIEAAKEAATEENPTMLVAQHTSRFARGDGAAPGAPKALVELYHEWARCNVRGRLVENDLAMSTSSAAAAQGEADHLESKRKSVSVKKGMRRRARDRGKISGGIRPYGYRWQGEARDKDLVIVPTEADVVRRMFNDTVANVSQMALAKALTAEGIPTVQGGEWLQATVGRVLRNPLYKGRVRSGGEEYKSAHEPIVTVELWQQAAQIREAAARTKGHGGGRWPKGSHLFTKGLLHCGTCEHVMIPRTNPKRRGGLYQVYICDGRRRNGPDFCPQTPVDRALLDEAMLGEFQRLYLDLGQTRERVAAKIATDASIATEQLDKAEHEVASVERKTARIEEDYLTETLSAAAYERISTKLADHAKAAIAERDRLAAHAKALAEARPLLDAESELLRQLAELRAAIVEHDISTASSLDGLRRTLHHLFEEVVYRPADHPITQLAEYRESVAALPGAFLEPHLRTQTIVGYTDDVRPIIRKTVLPLETETVGLGR